MKITEMSKTVAETNNKFVVQAPMPKAVNGRAFHAKITEINEKSYPQYILDSIDKLMEQGEV